MYLSKCTSLFIILVTLAFALSACGSSTSEPDSVAPSPVGSVDRFLSISDASLTEGNAGGATLTFTVSLGSPATGNVSVDYVTRDGSANAGIDYQQSAGTVTILDGEMSSDFSVIVYGDTTLEVNETFFVDITNLSGYAFWSNEGLDPLTTNSSNITSLTATGIIITDDASTPKLLNDTGSRFSGIDPSGNNAGCTGPTASAQDCSSGRDQDITTNSNVDGYAGFSFTKLDAAGNSLAASAADWACIKDNVTNLIWEVKQSSGSYDTANIYYWKAPGTSGDGITDTSIICSNPSDAAANIAYCNSSAFVIRANAEAYCGTTDWRLPRTNELLNIANLDTKKPAIDTLFFPNTQSDNYMTSYVRTVLSVRVTDVVDFTLGSANNQSVSIPYYIRLVSDPSAAPATTEGLTL